MTAALAWHPAWAIGPEQEGAAAELSEHVTQVSSALEKTGVTLSGAIEVEAVYTDDDRESGQTSDVTLATAELGVDVHPIDHVRGHILFVFEEDATDPIEVEEGYIRLDGEDKLPLYLQVGRQYLPFGYNESHFISDPPTLELGETRETAVVAGYAADAFEISLGLLCKSKVSCSLNGQSDQSYRVSSCCCVATPHSKAFVQAPKEQVFIIWKFSGIWPRLWTQAISMVTSTRSPIRGQS